MTHTDYVQEATDLLSETRDISRWLPLYDAALAAPSDETLALLVTHLRQIARSSHSLAA